MSLKVFRDLEQGSDEWLEARRGIVTASTVGRLITTKTVKPASNPESRALTRTLVAERITGVVEESFVSRDMWRGKLDEPIARDLYSEHYAPVTEVGFMTQDRWGFTIGCSPDGLVGDDGMIEIKSRLKQDQLAVILADAVPDAHMAQCQCALLVSGRKWLDYLSFSGGMPLFVKQVTPDAKWQATILAAVEQFEHAAQDMTDAYAWATKNLVMTEAVSHEMEIV